MELLGDLVLFLLFLLQLLLLWGLYVFKEESFVGMVVRVLDVLVQVWRVGQENALEQLEVHELHEDIVELEEGQHHFVVHVQWQVLGELVGGDPGNGLALIKMNW